jgi:hypothetical protein
MHMRIGTMKTYFIYEYTHTDTNIQTQDITGVSGQNSEVVNQVILSEKCYIGMYPIPDG